LDNEPTFKKGPLFGSDDEDEMELDGGKTSNNRKKKTSNNRKKKTSNNRKKKTVRKKNKTNRKKK
jgi:hypothetical protein